MELITLETVRTANWKREAFPMAAALLAFFIPIIKFGIQIPILLFVITWFFYPKRVHRYSYWPILVFGGLYIFYVIGMLYTANVSHGLNELTQKLSLIIFPFFFGFARPFSHHQRRRVLTWFVLGTFIAVLISFVSSAVSFADSKAVKDFYMSEFSLFFHPSYVAMYINIAIAVLLTTVTVLRFSKLQYAGIWASIFIFSLTLVFPASKMGFITFFLLIGFFLVKWAIQKRLLQLHTLLILVVGLLTFFFIRFDPVASARVGSALEYVEGERIVEKENQIESNAARVFAWKVTWNEIKKHPLGVGTGDVREVLDKRFRAEGLDMLADQKLNPHNQFLQTALAVGIPAALWFAFSLLFPFRKIKRTGDWLYALFLIIFGLNILAESMLEKQSGILFFAFFNSFFYFMTLRPNRI